MPLDNLVTKTSEAEAVAYAVADRNADTKNYNLEKANSGAYNEQTVIGLLQQANYRPYETFRWNLTTMTYGDANTRVWKLTQNKRSAYAATIAADFMARPKKKVHEVDERFRAAHTQYAIPVGTAMSSGLMLFEMEFSSLMKVTLTKTPRVTLDSLEATLRAYATNYYPPLSAETTTNGEYRVDDGHGNIDPLNPHNFRHVHVYHKLRNYHTTLRLA